MRLEPPGPFESTEVVVNSWPTSCWLGEQLAIVNGINACVQFPFPGSYFRKLVRKILGIEHDKKDPWRAHRLVWPLLELLPDFLERKEASTLLDWFSRKQNQLDQVNKENWQLARCIADAFDDYTIYRPDFINQSLENKSHSFNSREDFKGSQSWQPLLFKLLAHKIGIEPFSIQANKAVELLRNGGGYLNQVPNKLRFFGLSSLAPIQIELLQALSGQVEIQIFLLTPCPDLWKRCEKRRKQLGEDWSLPPDGNWLMQLPRIEATLGRMGAEFQQLLEGTGETLFGKWKEGDLFAAPANIANQSGRSPSLLEQIQQNLITTKPSQEMTLTEEDNSLLFLACPGQRRQIQLVRDQILQWLAIDPTLEPRDVLIMTPQVDQLAPIFSSVFNDVNSTDIDIPWRITDSNISDTPGLIQAVLKLLAIAGDRLNASNLENLLTNPAMRAKYAIDSQELAELSRTLQQTGFTWGIDKRERCGDEIHTLNWCLDRWLLGLIMPNTPGLELNGAAPFHSGLEDSKIVKWWKILHRITTDLEILRLPHIGKEWIELLRKLIDDLSDSGNDWYWERECLISALEDWKERLGECKLKIEVNVVTNILKENLSTKGGRYGHRSGAITLSSLEPMRAIPYRVIVLMGLDSDIFPRLKERPGFHLLENKRLLGDPRSSDQDRYVLLEALMSSRQHLLISWNSRNEHNGEKCQPPPPIQQWLSLLETELGEQILKGIVKEAPLNPLDRSNFQGRGKKFPSSCDKRQLETRVWLDKSLKLKSNALAHQIFWPKLVKNQSEEISYDELQHWLIAPQLTWLKQYEIRPKEWIDPLISLEGLKLNERIRDRLISSLFEEVRDKLSKEQADYNYSPSKVNWIDRLKGQGIMPPKSAEIIETEILEKRWHSLQQQLLSNGNLRLASVNNKGLATRALFSGNTSITFQPGVITSNCVMKAWLKHLYICSSSSTSNNSIIISRNPYKAKMNEYIVSLEWKSLSTLEATKYIIKLKDIAAHGYLNCWPIPPKSGWELAILDHRNPEKARQAFCRSWEGTINYKGERDQTCMRICFGNKRNAKDLIDTKAFKEAFLLLYQPIIKNIVF